MSDRSTLEKVLDAHSQTGYELPDGRLRVRLEFVARNGEPGSEWETIKRSELSAWLGY